jgi:hypothetical protein
LIFSAVPAKKKDPSFAKSWSFVAPSKAIDIPKSTADCTGRGDGGW